MSLGFSIFLCSGVSFLIFEETSPYAVLGSVLFFLLGLLIIIPTMFIERDYEYKPLKENKLIFDSMFLTELTKNYQHKKKAYIAMVIFLPVVIFLGVALFEIGKMHLLIEENLMEIVFMSIFALSFSTCIYGLVSMEAYEVLVYNEEYINRLSIRLLKKIRSLCK